MALIDNMNLRLAEGGKGLERLVDNSELPVGFFESFTQRIIEQVGIALRGLNLRVAEQLADYRQRHAD